MSAQPGQMGGPPLIIFDGVCVMCSAWARFVMRHDTRRLFLLTTAQSPTGRATYLRHALDPDAMETMIVAIDGHAHIRSDAILAVLSRLGWPWRAAVVMRIVPRPLRDAGYRWVARNRYRWFGKRDTCWLPDASTADRMV